MKKQSDKGRLIISLIALIIAIMTLALTSPILIDLYLRSKLEFTFGMIVEETDTLRLDIRNSGRRAATNVTIAIALRKEKELPMMITQYERIGIGKVEISPPKEYEVVSQDFSETIRLESPIVPEETVSLWIDNSFSEIDRNLLWIQIGYDGRTIEVPGMQILWFGKIRSITEIESQTKEE